MFLSSMPENDFILRDHGSVCILIPISQEANQFCHEFFGDDVTWFANGVVIEPRCVDDILDGILAEGFTI